MIKNGILPLFLIEPGSSSKRRQFSDKIVAPQKKEYVDFDLIRERLRKVRAYALDHFDDHCSGLQGALRAYWDVKVTFASNARGAVATIKEISESDPIAINKSSVVYEELCPDLVHAGLRVIDMYHDQFEPFENKVGSIRGFPFINADYMERSFECRSGLFRQREGHIKDLGAKNFTGLLGVNAASAKDGSIYFFQHMYNISDVLMQAKKLIIVIGLDKIVKDQEDALFQAMCMGIFGWDSIPASIRSRSGAGPTINDLPFDVPLDSVSNKIHIILLDNGRSALLQSRYRELLLCIGCRACAKPCPGSPFFREGVRLSPKEYLSSFISGRNNSLAKCLLCLSCKAECPLDIDIPGMILEARTSTKAIIPSTLLTDLFFLNYPMLAKWGASAPTLSNFFEKNKFLRRIGEEIVGISSKRELPPFAERTFSALYGQRRNKK